MPSFDPSYYLRILEAGLADVEDPSDWVKLARELIDACPEDAPAALVESCAQLAEVVEKIERALWTEAIHRKPPIELSRYTRAPSLTATSGLELARELIDACPEEMPATVHLSCARLARAMESTERALADREQALAEGASRGLLWCSELDISWSCLYKRLSTWVIMPDDYSPETEQAREVFDTIFADGGVQFLREDYDVQLEAADALLDRIDQYLENGKRGLQEAIDRFASPEFLDFVRRIHTQYRPIFAQRMPRIDDGLNMRAHLRELQSCIERFAKDMGEAAEKAPLAPGREQPELVEVAYQALEPLVMTLDRHSLGPARTGKEPHPAHELLIGDIEFDVERFR